MQMKVTGGRLVTDIYVAAVPPGLPPGPCLRTQGGSIWGPRQTLADPPTSEKFSWGEKCRKFESDLRYSNFLGG